MPVGAYGGRRGDYGNGGTGRPSTYVYQAGTFCGNPLSMTAGIHTLKRLKAPGNYEHLNKITSEPIQGIIEAGKKAEHAICDGYISGIFGLKDLFTTMTMQKGVTLQSLEGFIEEYCWRKVHTFLLHSLRLGLQAWHILLKTS